MAVQPRAVTPVFRAGGPAKIAAMRYAQFSAAAAAPRLTIRRPCSAINACPISSLNRCAPRRRAPLPFGLPRFRAVRAAGRDRRRRKPRSAEPPRPLSSVRPWWRRQCTGRSIASTSGAKFCRSFKVCECARSLRRYGRNVFSYASKVQCGRTILHRRYWTALYRPEMSSGLYGPSSDETKRFDRNSVMHDQQGHSIIHPIDVLAAG